MPHAPTASDELLQDPEIRDSIMIIRRQRTMKLTAAIVGLVAIAAIMGAAVYLAYSSELEATKDLPVQPR